MSAVQSVKRPRVAGYQNRIPSESGDKLYLKSKMADVYFTFSNDNGTTKRIPAHKSWLAAASDVFEAMFYGDLKEEGDVQMVDVSDAAFEEFLQCFYISEIELTAENVAEVMGLGHKYNVTKCVDLCVQFVKDNLNYKNTLTWLNVAILYQQNELLKLCDKHIVVNSSFLFKSNGFLECEKRVLEHILKMKILSCPETEVFEACMAWVKARSKQDVVSKDLIVAHLGDLFYEIRFGSMTIQQFVTLAASYDSVLSTDFRHITNMIAFPEFQSGQFNENPRRIEWNNDAVIKCGRTKGGGEWEVRLRNEEKTTFSTNEPLLLGGFVCGKVVFCMYDEYHESLKASLSVEVKITEASAPESDANETCLNIRASLESYGTEVLLPSPVLIRPGYFYTICLSTFPDDHFHCAKQLMTEIQMDSDITIKFHNDVTDFDMDEYEEVVVGLISTLMFNKI